MDDQTYRLYVEPLSWIEARQQCQRVGMRLVRLYSPLHAAQLNLAVQTGYAAMTGKKMDKYWIGLNDRRAEGTFTWDRSGNESISKINSENISVADFFYGALALIKKTILIKLMEKTASLSMQTDHHILPMRTDIMSCGRPLVVHGAIGIALLKDHMFVAVLPRAATPVSGTPAALS